MIDKTYHTHHFTREVTKKSYKPEKLLEAYKAIYK